MYTTYIWPTPLITGQQKERYVHHSYLANRRKDMYHSFLANRRKDMYTTHTWTTIACNCLFCLYTFSIISEWSCSHQLMLNILSLLWNSLRACPCLHIYKYTLYMYFHNENIFFYHKIHLGINNQTVKTKLV